MNRDEQRSRALGLPPAIGGDPNRHKVYPRESTGGTWCGVNDRGVAYTLINWYSVQRRKLEAPRSRGEVSVLALDVDLPEDVESRLKALELSAFFAFRLIGFFPERQTIMEWKWDQESLKRIDHGWSANVWISSGWDEPGAQRSRLSVFMEHMKTAQPQNVEWIRQFHRSHTPEQGPYSVCMHRSDAVTVSYTEIEVRRNPSIALMRHTLGAPCEHAGELPEWKLNLV